MSCTEQTQPTDAELIAFATEEQFLLFCDPDEFTDIARAVLAKWGTPAGAGEPEGWITWFRTPTGSREPIYSHGPKKPSHGAELDALLRKYPLFTTPQPTQAHIEKCAVCGDGNARLLVMRNCDVCGSDYAGQSESEVNVALERARRATQAQAGAVPLTEEQCEISSQCPRMNHALSETHGDVCIVYVDFACKRFNVSGSGSADEVPSVSIDPCDPSQGWEFADVAFPNRRGWDVVSASSSKYTLTAVLKRKGTDHG